MTRTTIAVLTAFLVGLAVGWGTHDDFMDGPVLPTLHGPSFKVEGEPIVPWPGGQIAPPPGEFEA